MDTIAKYTEWLEPEKLMLLQGWARDGHTDEMLARDIGITTKTLYEWKVRYPKFSEAIKKGKEVVDYAVENALLKKALSGDVTAMIFWLCNRRKDKWVRNPAGEADGTSVQKVAALMDGLDREAQNVSKREAGSVSE